MDDRCQIPRCDAAADLTYLDHGVCTRHWNQLTNENAPLANVRHWLLDGGPGSRIDHIPIPVPPD